ncbi:MAG: EAL domain-containing protein [Gammaproteobacteria bacterium]|nr:MAG: EAL domain-containing protein [Gammaproteobacteria bacterium]
MAPVQLRHKRIIESAIVVLALLVLTLSGFLAWRSYDNYRSSALAAAASELADALGDAMEHYTLERGLTMAALGAQGGNPGRFRSSIAKARQDADADWRTAMELASALTVGGDFKTALAQAGEMRSRLDLLRRRVDGYLAGETPVPSMAEWFETSTRLVAVSARVWETILFAEKVNRTDVGAFAMPRKMLWEAAEQAGEERALLAYYISTGAAVPAGDFERIQFARNMALFGIERVRRLLDVPTTDPRLTAAMAQLHEKYIKDFETARVAVHRAARTGRYPLDATTWIEHASQAIRTIHAVTDTITAITRDQVQRSRSYQMSWLGLALFLFTGSAGLSLASLTRVRLLVEDVFRQKERAEVTMDSIGDAVITTDVAARVEYLNPAAEELTGWSNVEGRGRPLAEVFRIVNGYSREPKENPVERCLRENQVVGLGNDTVLIRRDGMETTIEDSAAPVHDREGKAVGAVMVFYDVAASRGNTHLLSYHSTHDRLTGLVNRAELERRLKGALDRARSRGGQHALCYLDIDQFKVVNDTCGHAAGDRLLRELTRQFQTRVRDSDTLSHIGSDEFGLLLVSCPPDKAVAVAEDLLRLVRDFRFDWQGTAFHLTASIGVVPISGDETSASEVLAKADAACFAAKEKGRNRIQVYEPDNLEYARRHGEMQWVARLGQALEQERFRLYCQPIMPLAAKGPMHYEVLLRLEEDGQIVMPAEFIPAAERYGLMPQIDRWVAQRTFAALRAARPRGTVCNINLSGLSLGEEGFSEELRADYQAAGLPRGSVCFEITETAATTNMEQATRLIQALRGAGCRFALDDFGTGMCSFGYLKELHVDYLKIGGTFVRDMLTSVAARATVQAINAVGHTLDMRTVAEHVSSRKLLAAVRKLGIDYAQGYVLSRPMPIEDCMQKQLSAAAPRTRRHTRRKVAV